MREILRLKKRCLQLVFLQQQLNYCLWLMLVLTSFTAVQRFVKVWIQASAPRPERRWRALREWREWREGRLVDELRWPSTSPRWRARRQPRERPTSVRAWRRRAGTRP